MEIQKLEIRILKDEEIGKALTLVWKVFQDEIAQSYTEEGVQEFLRFIDYNFMKDLSNRGEIIFWGAFEEELIGTLAVRTDGHISLFFVKSEYQGLGIGKILFQMMYNYCVKELKVNKITVNSAPQSVIKYIHMGMRQAGDAEEKNGIRSVPMEMHASPALVEPIKYCPKKSKRKWWIILLVTIVILLAGVGMLGYNLYKKIVDAKTTISEDELWEEPYSDSYDDYYDDFYNDFFGDYYDDYYEEPMEEDPTYL